MREGEREREREREEGREGEGERKRERGGERAMVMLTYLALVEDRKSVPADHHPGTVDLE